MKLISASILTISILVLSSCGESAKKEVSQYDQVLQSVESQVKPKLNDPKSYEFVELVLIDSVLYRENVANRIDYFTYSLKSAKDRVEDMKQYKESGSTLYDSLEFKRQSESIVKYEAIINGIDSIKTQMGERLSDVASYTYSYSFRGNNKLGALVLNTYFIQTKPDAPFEVVNIAENEGKMFSTPNVFEGYEDLISREMK